MKKIILTIIILFIMIITIFTSMFIFQLCPPPGPWSSPPWCVYNQKIVPYNYTELNYITKDFKPTNKSLVFGIGTNDIWGNPHLWIDLGEETTKSINPTMKRINDIGGKLFQLTEMVILTPEGHFKTTTRKQAPYGYTITQKELNNIVKKAKENKINDVMLSLNLASTADEVEEYIKSANEVKNAKESWIGKRYKEDMKNNVGLSTGTELENLSELEWDNVIEEWKILMISEAKKAEKAGVNYLIINPGDVMFNNNINNNYLSKKLKEIAIELRKDYSGKLGVLGDIDFLSSIDTTQYDFVYLLFGLGLNDKTSIIFKNLDDNDFDSIKQGWEEYFELPEWDYIEKDIYLSISIESYDGALEKGWLEPGRIYGPEFKKDFKEQAMAYETMFETIYEKDIKNLKGIISYGYWWNDRLYPETKNLRNDLSRSIRSKDAEHIFYKWSNIFS